MSLKLNCGQHFETEVEFLFKDCDWDFKECAFGNVGFTILIVFAKMSSLSLVDLESEGNLELLN